MDRGVPLTVVREKGIFLDFLLHLQAGPGTYTCNITFGPYTRCIIFFMKLALLSFPF